MDLRDYPRPKDDTSIGVHWNAGFAAAIGLGQIEQIWLPRLRDMDVKWVKISQHDGAFNFARLLLKNDIMPIVRIYRLQSDPGILGPRELQAVSDHVSAGVRYIEFNNEPDLGVELFLKLSVEKWDGDAWEVWTLEHRFDVHDGIARRNLCAIQRHLAALPFDAQVRLVVELDVAHARRNVIADRLQLARAESAGIGLRPIDAHDGHDIVLEQ